jgi:hypothetical protein
MNSILQKRFVKLDDDDNDNGSVVMLGRDAKALAITGRDFVNKVRSSKPFSVYSCNYA